MLTIPQKIIISRTDNLGDVVLTLPLAGYIKQISPQTEILFIGKAYTRAIVQQYPAINSFVERDDVLKNPQILKRYQALIMALPDAEILKAAQKQGVPVRIATGHRFSSWRWASHRVMFSRRKSNLHEAQLNFKLLRPLGLKTPPTLSQLKLLTKLTPPTPTALVNKILEAAHPKKLVLLHPKSKGSAREWPLKHYYQLCSVLPANDYCIGITGTQAEGEKIKNELPEIFNLPNVKNLTGLFSLTELMALIGKATALVASSTGPLHLAAGLGIKTIGVYPPMRPLHPGRWAALGPNVHIACAQKTCNLCRKSTQCPCINQIQPEQLLAWL